MKRLAQYRLCLNRDTNQEPLKYKTKLLRRHKPELRNLVIRNVLNFYRVFNFEK